jgi:RNA polymerase sigma factor (TIGR02999 family)
VNRDSSASGIITRHLQEWRAGDEAALTRLTEEIYSQLRQLSGAVLGSRAGFQSFQPTELVHELYFRLPALQTIDWQGRAHFLNVAALVMRRILIDCARKLQAAKRGGPPITLSVQPAFNDSALEVDVLWVHDALSRFAATYPRQAHVVELRFFGGLTTKEASDVLKANGYEASIRSVERDWTFAKAWMQNDLAKL